MNKKTKAKNKAVKASAIPVGRVVPELVVWDFSEDEEVIRHIASELARAIQLSYSLNNFGLSSFGMEEGE